VQVEGFLLPGMHVGALQRLRSLGLVGLKIQRLRTSEACALNQLSELDLSCNEFAVIPAAVAHITTLQTLDLSGNVKLRLQQGDVDTVACLPHLQSLRLTKEDSEKDGGLNRDMGNLLALAVRFPKLKFPGLV
jgi:Leucine-rich repeat (LRR) protein